MKDTIYRQAAIEAIEKIFPVDQLKNEYTQGIAVGAALATEYIKQLPSAQPERKNGHWEMVPDPYGFFDEIPVCSECGCTTEMRKTYKFCPNCGADMRGG